MGADVLLARPDLLGSSADEVLGWSLREIISDGSESELLRTDRAQPVLYAISYALWSEFRALVDESPAAAAGHSLGEYTALAAAGAVGYFEGLALVAARGSAMADAAKLEPSAMAALVGADRETAERIALQRRATGGRLWVASYNAPGQIVLAGGVEDIEWLTMEAYDLGARRAIQLNVAAAFHSPFMASAMNTLRDALEIVDFTTPSFPVYANATAQQISDIPAILAQQLVSAVHFTQSLEQMAADGIEMFVHIGPGDVTAGLAKRSVKDALVMTVSQITDILAVQDVLTVQ